MKLSLEINAIADGRRQHLMTLELLSDHCHFDVHKALTRRENQVLAGILEGLGNKEIAWNLHICTRTVKYHVSSVLRKFNVKSRVQIARAASMDLENQL